MKMKNVLLMSLLLLSKNSFAGCLFGGNLVEMARMSDLSSNSEKKIRANTRITENLSMAITRELQSNSIEEALEKSDQYEFYWRNIKDKHTQEKYDMILYRAGGNYTGFILKSLNGDKVADVSDGLIENCTVAFDQYQNLPWFYTN